MALNSLKSGVKERVRACEDWWFDTSRHVRDVGAGATSPVSRSDCWRDSG